MQTAMRLTRFGFTGGIAVGLGAAALWGAAAGYLGHRYEKLRRGAALGGAAG